MNGWDFLVSLDRVEFIALLVAVVLVSVVAMVTVRIVVTSSIKFAQLPKDGRRDSIKLAKQSRKAIGR